MDVGVGEDEGEAPEIPFTPAVRWKLVIEVPGIERLVPVECKV
jgi:hypothetical protein